jgi:hypothetical protein
VGRRREEEEGACSLSLLGRLPPLHLLLAAAVCLPGQVPGHRPRSAHQTAARSLQADWLRALDPGATMASHL